MLALTGIHSSTSVLISSSAIAWIAESIVSTTVSPGWTPISWLTGALLLPTGSARKRSAVVPKIIRSGIWKVEVDAPVTSPNRARSAPRST